jgi:hypothetical protein
VLTPLPVPNQDFAFANSSSSIVSIRHGDGDCSAEPNSAVGSASLAMAVDDFNSDGKPELS